jgi:hypothetical protein
MCRYGVWAGDGVEDLVVANLTLRDFYSSIILETPGHSAAHLQTCT